MSDEQLARQTASSFDRLENFNFLLSRHDPNLAKSRHYSFDADSTGLAAFSNLNMDYDQTEGMGGLSVSSYDSIEDERSPIDVRGYPYHGKSPRSMTLIVASFAQFSCFVVRFNFVSPTALDGFIMLEVAVEAHVTADALSLLLVTRFVLNMILPASFNSGCLRMATLNTFCNHSSPLLVREVLSILLNFSLYCENSAAPGHLTHLGVGSMLVRSSLVSLA